MEVNDEYLDINVFEKLMEGNHKEIMSNDDDDSMSINSTNTLSHYGQNNITDTSCFDNNNNNNNDEIAYQFNST
jgi:hypothetical protein